MRCDESLRGVLLVTAVTLAGDTRHSNRWLFERVYR